MVQPFINGFSNATGVCQRSFLTLQKDSKSTAALAQVKYSLLSFVIGHWSLVISYWSLVIGHWSLVIGQWLLVIGIHTATDK